MKKEIQMVLANLTHEEAIVILGRIAHQLEHTEDSSDFCLWLAEVLENEAGLKIDLSPK